MSSSDVDSAPSLNSSFSSIDDIATNGIEGYQLEPEYTEAELQQIEDVANARRQEIKQNPRKNNTNWCLCTNCVSLPLPSECLCCHEFSLFEGNLESGACITDNADFRLICLNRVVLQTSYVSFLRYKRYRGRAPDELTNTQSRLMAYRQFVCWVRKGKPLGKKIRVILPSCVVRTIRNEFPSADGVYEGFKECDTDSDSD